MDEEISEADKDVANVVDACTIAGMPNKVARPVRITVRQPGGQLDPLTTSGRANVVLSAEALNVSAQSLLTPKRGSEPSQAMADSREEDENRDGASPRAKPRKPGRTIHQNMDDRGKSPKTSNCSTDY